MKNFFQRHSGARKPTSDPTSNYQAWLPPAIEPDDNRSRHRTTREPINSTVDVQGAGERRGPSRAHQVTEVYSVPHVASSVYDYTTYPSTGRGYHGPVQTQIASTAFASVATPSYRGPGQNLDGSGWSTRQRLPPPTLPPSADNYPVVYREDDPQRQRRSNERFGVADKRGEGEQRTRETDAEVARYKAKVAERTNQKKDYIQHIDGDADRRRVLNDERERRDRRRSRERRKRDKEKESESDRDRDWERERNERRERGRIRAKEKEYREAHREREGDRNRSLIGGWSAERNADRDMTSNLRRERERNEPGERDKENLDLKGKTRAREEEPRDLAKEHRLNAKGRTSTGRHGTGGKSEVHRDLREGHPYVTGLRDMESETNQRRRHDRIREPDQRERRRNDRKDNDYLDRRFEPGNVEWISASTHNVQPSVRHRPTPAHDEINSDSSPRKNLTKLSKHKRNLTDVEAPHLSITTRRDSVPSAPSDPTMAYPRQAAFASNSRENQAGLNQSSSSFGHHGKESVLVAAERPSRADSIACATPDEIGRLKHKERNIGSNPSTTFPPASSAELMHDDVQLSNSNAGQTKYDEASNSLSSRWPFWEKRSNSGPSLLVDNATSIHRIENQRLEEQTDHTIMIPKTMYTSASRQAALREAEAFDASKHLTHAVEKHSKPHLKDVPKVDSLIHPVMTHPIPSVVSAMTDAQLSAVRGSRMEQTASRTVGLQMSDALIVPPSSVVDEQIKVLFMHGGKAPSDIPTVDISRNRLESAGSKNRTPIAAHLVHEAPKPSDHVVPSDDYLSIPSRTTTSNKVLCQIDPKVPEAITSRSHDTLLSVSKHIRNNPSTPVVVKDPIAQPLAVPPSMRHTSAQGRAINPVVLQLHTTTEHTGAQGTSYPSIVLNDTTEHQAAQQVSTRPITLPKIQPVDTTIDSKVSSTLDNRTQRPPSRTQYKPTDKIQSQQGKSGPSFSIGITSTQPWTPVSSKQTSSTEYLPQNENVCQARTHKTASGITSYPQTQTSYLYRPLQGVSVDQHSKARVFPILMQSSSAVVSNERADHSQTSSTDILDQGNHALTISMVDQALIPTSVAKTCDQLSRHPKLIESGSTRLGAQSIVQQKMTEMTGEVDHSEDKPDAPGALIEVNVTANSITSPSSNENLDQVHPSSDQVVHYVHEFIGNSLQVSSHVKTRAFSSDLPTPETVAMDVNLLQSERPRGLNIDTSPASIPDKKHVDSRYTNIKAGDDGEVITFSIRDSTINPIGYPSDKMPSDRPSRYLSSESPCRDEKGQVTQRDPQILSISAPKLLAEYQASSFSKQFQPEAALQILRPSTVIGHRHTSGEALIPLSTADRDVPSDDKTPASAIRRPATAMGSLHYRSERLRHDVSQAHQSKSSALLQSRSTDASDALTHDQSPVIMSAQPTNNSDVTEPVNTEGISSKYMRTELRSTSSHCPEDQSRKMQLQSYMNTLETKSGLPVTKKDILAPGIDGASVGQATRGDAEVAQHHMAYDKNAASYSQDQLKESANRAIAASRGDQPPIQNAKLAELLSNPPPLNRHIPTTETINDLQNPREVFSRPSVNRPGTEQSMAQLTQPEAASSNQKIRGDPERSLLEVDSRQPTVQKSSYALEQSRSLRNNITPSRVMLVSGSQQNTPGSSNIFPLTESTVHLRIDQDLPVGSKFQKSITSRNGNHGSLSSVVPGFQQETQTPIHTNIRHYDQSRVPYKNTGELSLRTPPLPVNPVNGTFPPSMSVGIMHTSGYHQTSSERAVQSKEQSKTSHKHSHLSHSAPVHIDIQPNSLAYHAPDTVPASHIPGHQQPRGAPNTWDHDHHKSPHKTAVASSSTYIAPSNVSRSQTPFAQRNEPPRHRNHTANINNSSSSQTDLIPNRHVTASSSQVAQSSLQTNVSVPSQSVSSSVKPRTISQSNIKIGTRSAATVYPSESRHDHPGVSASESKTRTSAHTKPAQSRPDTTLRQSIPTSSRLPEPPPSRYNRELSRRTSEDSVLLKTPSSLAPTVLKASTSRTSIPASFSSQTSSRKRGLFGIFRSKFTQPPDQVEESQKSAPRKLRKESKIRTENLLETVPPQNSKATSAVSSRPKAPPITVPIPIPPVAERKSPNNVFTPFRYLTTKRNRRVSQASLEAQDGTAPNTVIGSPTASMHSTQPPPIQPPPLRDVFTATQEWRHMEAAEVREVTGGRLRRARPGVVFDVAEDHTEEHRPKIRPQRSQ